MRTSPNPIVSQAWPPHYTDAPVSAPHAGAATAPPPRGPAPVRQVGPPPTVGQKIGAAWQKVKMLKTPFLLLVGTSGGVVSALVLVGVIAASGPGAPVVAGVIAIGLAVQLYLVLGQLREPGAANLGTAVGGSIAAVSIGVAVASGPVGLIAASGVIAGGLVAYLLGGAIHRFGGQVAPPPPAKAPAPQPKVTPPPLGPSGHAAGGLELSEACLERAREGSNGARGLSDDLARHRRGIGPMPPSPVASEVHGVASSGRRPGLPVAL